MEAGFFVGAKPWDLRKLESVGVADMEAAVRVELRRFNRLARLAAWIVACIPVAVAKGIAIGLSGTEPRTILKHWTVGDLVRVAPGFDEKAEEDE